MEDTPIIKIPENMTIEHLQNGLVIKRKWTDVSESISVFSVTMPVALSFVCLYVIFLTSYEDKALPVIMLPCMIVANYWTIANWKNTASVLINQNQIEVSQRPVPWMGSQKVDTSSIQQLFCKKTETNIRNTNNFLPKTKLKNFQVHVLTDKKRLLSSKKKTMKLVSGLQNGSQARFI